MSCERCEGKHICEHNKANMIINDENLEGDSIRHSLQREVSPAIGNLLPNGILNYKFPKPK